MSGGALDYLYSKEIDQNFIRNLTTAIEHLESWGLENSKAYQDLSSLYSLLKTAESEWDNDNLKTFLRTIEWCMSGDYSQESIFDGADEYEKAPIK